MKNLISQPVRLGRLVSRFDLDQVIYHLYERCGMGKKLSAEYRAASGQRLLVDFDGDLAIRIVRPTPDFA